MEDMEFKKHKFEYEMLQDEINANSTRGNIFKTVMIPVSLTIFGLAIKDNTCKGLIIGFFLSFGLIFTTLLFELRISKVNRKFYHKQDEIKEKIFVDYKGIEFSDEHHIPILKHFLNALSNYMENHKIRLDDIFGLYVLLFFILWILVLIFY